MLGREVERRAAESALGSAMAGRGCALSVAGEAGIGKTTLVRSVVERAGASGALVRWGTCWEGGSLLPFAPWMDALRRPGGDRCGAVAVRLTDGGAEQGPDAAAARRARSRLFGEVVDALAEAASTQPQVVVLEDLHWADAPTLELVRAVAPHLASMAALLVATYRDDEFDAGTELAGIGGGAEWLTLGGLAERDVASLLADVLGREPSADEVRGVHARRAATRCS